MIKSTPTIKLPFKGRNSLVLIFLVIANLSYGQYISRQTGDFHDPNTWTQLQTSSITITAVSGSGTEDERRTLWSQGGDLSTVLSIGDPVFTNGGNFMGIVESFVDTNALLVKRTNSNVTNGTFQYPLGTAAAATPTSGDNIYIVPGDTVTLTTSESIRSLFVCGGTENVGFVLNGANLNASNDIRLEGPSTDGLFSEIYIGNDTLECNRIQTEAAYTNSRKTRLFLNDGFIDVRQEFDVDNSVDRHETHITGTGQIDVELNFDPGVLFPGSGTINMYGNFTGGRLNGEMGTINVYGTNVSNFSWINNRNLEVYNLNLYCDASVPFGNTIRTFTILNNLNLNGVWHTNNHILSLAAGATITTDGAFGTSAMVNTEGGGFFEVNAADNDATAFQMTYPIGSGTDYRPVYFSTVASVGVSPSISLSTQGSASVVSTGTNKLQRLWQIKSNNISGNVDGGFSYNQSEVIGDEMAYEARVLDLVNPPVWNTIAGLTTDDALDEVLMVNIPLPNGTVTAGETSTFIVPAGANTIYSVSSGSWNTASNWSTGAVPTAADDVYILHDITFNVSPAACNNLFVDAGCVVNLSDETVTVNGQTNITGRLRDDNNTGVLTFIGQVNIYKGGILDLGSISTAANCDFQGGIMCNGYLNGKDASFTTNDQLITGTGFLDFENVVVDVNLINRVNSEEGFRVRVNNVGIAGSGSFINYGVLSYDAQIWPTVATFDCSTSGNTVRFGFNNNSNIEPGDYYNVIIENGDERWSRDKNMNNGDYNIAGDLMVLSNAYSTADLNLAIADQTITVGGDIIVDDLSRILTPSTGAYMSVLSVGGSITNNNLIDLFNNGTRYVDLVLTSDGDLINGDGDFELHNLSSTGIGIVVKEITSSGQFTFRVAGTSSFGISNTNAPLEFTAGNIITNERGMTIDGDSPVIVNDIAVNGNASLMLMNDLAVNGLFTNALFSNNANFVDLNNQILTINGDYDWSNSNSLLGSDSSTIIINGSGDLTGTLNFKTGSENNYLSTLVINRDVDSVKLGEDMLIIDSLVMTSGSLGLNSKVLTYSDSAKLIYNGTATQEAGAEWFATFDNDIVIANTAGVSLNEAKIMNDTILLQGVLNLGDFNLIMTSIDGIEGTFGASSLIIADAAGMLNYTYASPTNLLYPIGNSGNEYSPVEISMNPAMTAGTLGARVVDTKHPSNAKPTNYLDKYWVLDDAGTITTVDADAAFYYDAADVAGDENLLYSAQWSGTQWNGYDTLYKSQDKGVVTLASVGEFTGYEFTPDITFDATALAFGMVEVGTTSGEQSFTITGSEMVGDLVIGAPTDFEVSLTSGSGFGSMVQIPAGSGYYTDVPVYVRYAPSSNGAVSLSVNMASLGVPTEYKDVTGTGNDAPTDIALSETTLDENIFIGSFVAELTTTDTDAGPYTYALAAGTGDANNNIFAISNDTLYLMVDTINYETTTSLEVRIQTTDAGLLSFEKEFVISVNDVNEAASDIQISAYKILDGTASGVVVGTLSAIDEDAGQTHTFALVAGTGDTDNGSFTINGSDLETAATMDIATEDTLHIRVEATDDGTGSLTFEKEMIIVITPQNVAPTDITLSATSIDENNLANAFVAELSTVDTESDQNYTYALVAGSGDTDNASFSISNDTLYIVDVADLETQATYAIRIQSTDDGLPAPLSVAIEATITINNVNEAPTAIALSADTVLESASAGSVVAALTATDVDNSDTHTYTLVTGTGDDDNASFAINGSDLETAVALDYETQDTFKIRLQVEDAAGLTFEEAFIILVKDVNEAPTALALSADTVSENMPIGTVVAILSATDEDMSESHTYALVTGTGDTDNASFTISGDELQTAESFDYEAQSTYSILIQVTDAGGLTYEEAVTITVIDVLETGIEEEIFAGINIYPIPTAGMVTVELNSASLPLTYSLTDVTGKVLSNGQFNDTESILDLSGNASGIYFLNVTKENTSKVFSIVVE